ncbi:calcium-binding protein [Microvirga sp. CF3062]|uniref:calcium-binding protein n=1 Tax=Microvirga sp. CF3062 TaxID=3110182 RepID=UPI002E7784AD|nr:calcium-binding protein [Microvirga sp. CF3062]MEE1657929.1 calcium-binding protein [Microvirga sp. CF3062]
MPQPLPSGSPFTIGAAKLGTPADAKITALQDGGFAAVWTYFATDGTSVINLQLFNADNTQRGGVQAISQGTGTTATNADITVLTDGKILVAWQNVHKASEYEEPDQGIFAQLYHPDGGKIGDSFPATGILGGGADSSPSVTALANGQFMIGWNDHNGTSAASRHLAYRYTGAGAPTELSSVDAMYYNSPQGDVTGMKNGGYVHVATLLPTSPKTSDGSGTTVFLRLYREGSPDGYMSANLRVNTSFTGDQHQVSAVTLSNGNIAIVWTDENTAADESGSCVKARIFKPGGENGVWITGEIRINTTTLNHQSNPVIAADNNGGFIVAFEDGNLVSRSRIRAATFDATGARTSDDFLVSNAIVDASTLYHRETDASITMLKDGRFVVSWTDEGFVKQGKMPSVKAQVFGSSSTGGGGGGGGNPDPDPDPVPNILTGDDGDNVFDGTKVQGLIDGRGGKDTVTYQAADGGVVILLANPEFNARHAAGDTFKDIEVIIGSTHDDELIGDAQAQEFQGANGHDTLMGFGGNDALLGGDGNDTLSGGEGADWLDGGTGINVVSYAQATSGVIANLQNPGANAGEAAGDSFNLIQNLTGSRFNDTLTGDGASNTLVGGDGNDLLVGGEGADHLIGGNGDDTLDGGGGTDILEGGAGRNTYVNADQDQIVNELAGSFDVIQTTSHFVLNEASAIEGIVADPNAGAINLTGNRSSNNILGNRDANVLIGLDGDDILSGAGGSDDVRGGLGQDVLTGGTGKDMLTGGTGRDMFVFDDKETGSSKSNADTITDFSGKHGDRIDLKAMDANTKKRGDQKFSFIGEEESFSKAGEVRFEKVKGYTYVHLNTDSDKAAEAVIKLKGAFDLSKSWFLL